MVFDMVDVSRILQGSYISIFRSLPVWEALHLLCVSRVSSKCHPWSLRGLWRLLRGVLVVFDMVDAPRILQGIYISIFRSIPAWEVLHLLCVSRVSSWSLRGHWRFLRRILVFLRWWMPQGYIKEAAYQFSNIYLPGKCSISYVS